MRGDMRPNAGVADVNDDGHESPTWERLEDQIRWYDQRSTYNQRMFKWLKVSQIGSAALVPVVAGLGITAYITGGLGALIVVLEGLLQMNQYQQNWINYRSTCEALKHEKFLFLAEAGPYSTAEKPEALLA